MDEFFERNSFSSDIKSLFILANIGDEEFLELRADRILTILQQDLVLLNEFLTVDKKEIKKIPARIQHDSSNSELRNYREDKSTSNAIIIDEPLNDNDLLMMDDIEEEVACRVADISKKSSVGSSYHKNLADNFVFTKNSLYYMLDDEIEGKVILGVYKHEKVLFERRLKQLIVKKVITENELKYTISSDRFVELRNLLKELFPTIDEESWYKPPTTDGLGNRIPASGCLLNFYKKFKGELSQARIITHTDKNRASSAITVSNTVDGIEEDDWTCLTDPDQSKYLIEDICRKWQDTFVKRLAILIQIIKKKIVIRTDTYLNTFACLKQPFGLSLLHSDCSRIIQNLLQEKKIKSKTADNFNIIFERKWPVVAESIIKIMKNVTSTDGKEFKRLHGDSISKAPASTVALFYLAIALTKAVTIKKSTKDLIGTIFQRSDISNHFIKQLETETQIEGYKTQFQKTLSDIGHKSHPYVIVCGKNLADIRKAFVVVNGDHYRFEDPIKAVDACFRSSVALHCWSTICANIWLYLQYHIYDIEPNVSCAFPQAKAFKSVKDFKHRTGGDSYEIENTEETGRVTDDSHQEMPSE